jgi:tRNA modification GTPase
VALCGKDVPRPREAVVRTLVDRSGQTIDQGIVLWFLGPRSFTGEDLAEFQVHGGRAVLQRLLDELGSLEGCRPAEPGEFTRRAVESGKLDVTQAEALADLIDAQTEAQRRQALRIAGGALRRQVEAWRAALIDALALVEAALDFSDEADVSAFDGVRLHAILGAPLAEMRRTLKAAPASERMRDGFLVMILGRPNAGKSTLLNALARRDLAIVSPSPGTTRDMIEAHLDLGGLPITFVDTAGLREAADEIEKIGVDRVLDRIETADLGLWLSADGEEPDQAYGVELVRVATKGDLVAPPPGWLGISAANGAGLETLLAEVSARARDRLGDGASALLIRERHRRAVASAASAIDSALAPGKELEFIAEDLRAATRALGRIVGAVDVEDVLDAVFARFCIGK